MDIRNDIEAWISTSSVEEAVEGIMAIVSRVAYRAALEAMDGRHSEKQELALVDAIVAKALSE